MRVGHQLLASLRKEGALLLRDRGALMSLFILPVIFVAVFGAMFQTKQGEAAKTDLALFSEDRAVSGILQATMEGSGLFRIQRRESKGELEKFVKSDDSHAALWVPEGFMTNQGTAELLLPPSLPPSLQGPLHGTLQAILLQVRFGQSAGETLSMRFVGEEKRLKAPSGFQLSVPGNAVLFAFFLALTVALSFVEERESGIWRRTLAAPVSRGSLLWAKLIPYFFVGLAQMTLLFGVGVVLWQMQVAGSVFALALLCVAVVLCATSLGLLMAALGGSAKQLGSMGSIVLLIMGLLGGTMMPRLAMPKLMQDIGLVTPHAWALDGFYEVLLKPGAGIAEVILPICVLLAYSLVFTLLGLKLFRFQ